MIFPVNEEHKNPPPKQQRETETLKRKILNKVNLLSHQKQNFILELDENCLTGFENITF